MTQRIVSADRSFHEAMNGEGSDVLQQIDTLLRERLGTGHQVHLELLRPHQPPQSDSPVFGHVFDDAAEQFGGPYARGQQLVWE